MFSFWQFGMPPVLLPPHEAYLCPLQGRVVDAVDVGIAVHVFVVLVFSSLFFSVPETSGRLLKPPVPSPNVVS